ncbi:hypothetical protein CG723_44875 [Streptomyces sp. CB01635]|nr:hypothetical protein CG723_44875 [Streptomyces sp. CB01635]
MQTLAVAGELQRDLQRELTYDGRRAAEAKGNKGGRRPAVDARHAHRRSRARAGSRGRTQVGRLAGTRGPVARRSRGDPVPLRR